MQLGGGIRDMQTVEGWLAQGRGPRDHRHGRGARSRLRARGRAALHPGKIAVGIDAKDGLVAVEGWAQTSTLSAEELGRRFEDAGVAAIIYTDIARDGILKGLNIPMTLALARAVSIPVIASGGLASMADIERLTQPDCAVLEGAISGRALYDGRIDPRQALALLRATCQQTPRNMPDRRTRETCGWWTGVNPWLTALGGAGDGQLGSRCASARRLKGAFSGSMLKSVSSPAST